MEERDSTRDLVSSCVSTEAQREAVRAAWAEISERRVEVRVVREWEEALEERTSRVLTIVRRLEETVEPREEGSVEDREVEDSRDDTR